MVLIERRVNKQLGKGGGKIDDLMIYTRTRSNTNPMLIVSCTRLRYPSA